MNAFEIATNLIESPRDMRLAIFSDSIHSAAVEIAEALQNICYEVWTEQPKQVSEIVNILKLMADATGDVEVAAYGAWSEAIEALVEGDPELCIKKIKLSHSRFLSVNRPHLAAKTQTSKLYALALLGRYDEAVHVGLQAREIFIRHHDLYSTGKIEHNIGNLFWRRDMYSDAEPFLESAHGRFSALDDQRQMAMVENCQAFVRSLQNRFREAEWLYFRALDRARELDLVVTEAEIETGLSNLYLFEGKYAPALKFMERSRQKYESLGMVYQSTNCELEMADIYLELNLLNEAIDYFVKVESRYSAAGVQAELARCLKNHALAQLRSGNHAEARILLDRSQVLFENEGNEIGVGSVMLARANLSLTDGDLDDAYDLASTALVRFQKGENLRLELYARWLKGEILRKSGRLVEAKIELTNTITAATDNSLQVEYLCLISLGHLTGDDSNYVQAIEIVENSRASLVSADIRTSYFADKVLPYNKLVASKLREDNNIEAFRWHERSRGRTLMESLVRTADRINSDPEADELREELNWLNNRLNRSTLSGNEEKKQIVELRRLLLEREREYAELKRRRLADGSSEIGDTTDLDPRVFCRNLENTTVVEFVAIDGCISAFIFRSTGFSTAFEYADERQVNSEIRKFLFQINTGRFIDKLSPQNRAAATKRLEYHSRRLFDLLLRPLGDALDTDRLVFAPAGMLHYLPFHALSDGSQHLIERFEISYCPSVSLLDRCLKMPQSDRGKALIAGLPNKLTPQVMNEINTVGSFFEAPNTLTGRDVTFKNIQTQLNGTGVVHIACHGKFRTENSSFSSLALFEEEMTVNDVQNLRLKNSIVVLSACESGLNEVVRGEELIGLTQAFFAAGASSLVMSLWRINDKTTMELMTGFYSRLSGDMSVAGSIRAAQIDSMRLNAHPYFWAPFVVSGRW